MTSVSEAAAWLNPGEERVVNALLEEVYPRMSIVFGARCCLAASRAVVEGLRAAGITANPCPVQVTAVPPNLARRIEEEGRGPADDDEQHEWLDGQTAHGIAFGREDLAARVENSWIGGHCVVVMLAKAGGHVLLDPSIQQLHYPEHGVAIPRPIALPASAEFAAGEEEVAGDTREGVRLVYRAHPEHQSYLETEAYMAPELEGPFSPISALIFHFKRRGSVLGNGDG